MLSILIPIYNFDVRELVSDLVTQCEKMDFPFQILCMDDCSETSFKELNRSLDGKLGVAYIELSENLGRSKIRNRLAKNAQYNNLLFLDCDSQISKSDFIQQYVPYFNSDQLIYGGRIYQDKKPANQKYVLHWKYGTKRESLPVKIRVKKPIRSFQSNNFMITRKQILKVGFDESIQSYGYEDLLFAMEIMNEGIRILHIDNPLIHKGLESNVDFIRKSGDAAKVLAKLFYENRLASTKMLDFHQRIKKVGFNSILAGLAKKYSSTIFKNLSSSNPNLYLFDLYRYQIFNQEINSLKESSS